MDEADTTALLAGCDTEAITRMERIQSFGFLLALTRDWIVVRASANLGDFLGIGPARALGCKLDELVESKALHDLRNRPALQLATKEVDRIYRVVLCAQRPPFDIAIHCVDGHIILEGEPSSDEERGDTASLVRSMVLRLSGQATLDAFHRDAARQVRALTGFERVMIYRLDASGAGEVIAESAARGVDSFLGLHYPASDIPVQARALYLRNTFRVIADVDSQTVPLLADPEGAEPIDQSMAFTRAVSPIHLEYLRNMGVAASMSISIVVDGALWGLIACHHRSPRLPGFLTRTATELFGLMYSLKLEKRVRRAAAEVDEQVQDLGDHLSKSIAADYGLLGDAARWRAQLCPLIECDGVAVVLGSSIETDGSTPSRSDIEAIAQGLDSMTGQRIFATDFLASLRPDAVLHADAAAGVLAIPVSRGPHHYILLFRRERALEVKWAGNPDKAVLDTNSIGQLSPRKSFAEFRIINRGRSLAFTEQDRRSALTIRSALIEATLNVTQEGDATMGQRQELLIAELNHRVRNILALVHGLINQPGGRGGDVATYVQSLNGRVQALARAHDQITSLNWGPGSLSTLVTKEIQAFIPNRTDQFSMEGPRVYLQPQALSTFSLIIHELVTNSVKYGSLSGAGRVSLSFELRIGEGLFIRWRETGGPPVHVPRRRGFGSVIIERVVPFDLKGDAQVRYEPGGLEADFFIPEVHIATELTSYAPDEPVFPPPEPLAIDAARVKLPLDGLTVLLLEDNLILALETEDLLHGLGAKAVCMASSIEAAEEILRNEHLDFALLDVHVGTRTSLKLAQAVQNAAIPYVFATGYGDSAALGVLRHTALVVSKPYGRLDLSAAIARALSGVRDFAAS